jgi:hypothetical protein
MPESDDYTLCVHFVGKIRKQDHETFMTVPMKAMIERNGFFNLVILYGENHSYDEQAADANIRSVMAHAPYLCRGAYVNPTPRKLMQIRILRELYNEDAELRCFNSDDLAEAIAWAKQGRPAAGTSPA